MEQLDLYSQKIRTLKRGGTKYGLAPHKPILLLSLIDRLEAEVIKENKILIDLTLFDLFKRNWSLLVHTANKCDITLPLYHLQFDQIWKVITKEGKLLDRKLSSEKQILKHVAYGKFDDGLFRLLTNKEYRSIIKMIILDTYFSKTQANYIKEKQLPLYIKEVEAMVLEDPKIIYRKTISSHEGYVRDWKFRINVMNAYDHTCCMSKLKIVPNYPIIEACHIQPIVVNGINTITNGIPLCVNLHRAFDNGLISISDSYKILVKGKSIFKENDSPFNLRQLEGKQLLLPANEKFYPSLEKIQWHRTTHQF